MRREHEIYDNLRGSFMPSVEGWDDDGTRPLLALEDLSDADWTPRWDDARVAAVRSALAELAASAPPPRTQPVREAVPGLFGRWQVVADDPAPFLSAGVRSSAWLDEWLPVVLAAADAVPADGDALLHLDVRSDNLCFRDGVALLVDWNWASLGNAELDVGAWLPSLALEGGPDPWEVLPGAGEIAAFMAGIWAAVVGLLRPRPLRACAAFSCGSSRWRSPGASTSSGTEPGSRANQVPLGSQRSWSANRSSSLACKPTSPASIAAFTSRASARASLS